MFRSLSQTGVSAGALILALSAAQAQEALPTIDIGAQSGSGASTGPVAKGGPKDPTAYKVWNASTGTKTDTPLMKTPVSVQVVPRQVLDDQQAVGIDQALRNVSNVYEAPYFGQQGGWNIRGFLDYAHYLDGVRVNPFSALPPRDTVDLQQIEVVKGPASILYGRIQPGGLVAITTKRPEREPHYSVQQIIGSYGEYRTLLNATGPLNEEKTLLYRFDASYRNLGSYRDGFHSNNFYLAPKLYFEPDEQTQATMYLKFYRGRDAIDAGVPLIVSGGPASGVRLPRVPINFNYSGRDTSLQTKSDFRFGYNLTHAFDKDWKIVHRLDINLRDLLSPWTDVYNPGPRDCSRSISTVCRDSFLFNIQENNYFTSLELTGHFDTYGLAHTLLVGADGYAVSNEYHTLGNFIQVPTVELGAPDAVDLTSFLYPPDLVGHTIDRQSWFGVYAQDQVDLPYDFHLLAGLRYDSARVSAEAQNTFFGFYDQSSSSVSADAVKPRVGLLWQPIPMLSLYGNYVEGFGVSNGRSTTNQPLPPEEAQQWEGGAKVELFDGKLTATTSYFDILKTNVRSPVPGFAVGSGQYETTGAVRNKGVELDVQGQITDELKVIGSYAYIDSRIVSDIQGAKVGNHWWGVPRHGGSLWAVYEPQYELLRGFAFGAGFTSRGSSEVNRANSFSLPGYTLVDLMARYSFDYDQKKITFQLNVNNAGDQRYYVSGGTDSGFLPGSPRIIRGSVKVEF